MLPGLASVAGFASAINATPITVTFTVNSSDTGSNPSFTGSAIGTAASDRNIVVAVSSVELAQNIPGAHNSVTVAGTACTRVANVASGTDVNGTRTSLWITNSPVTSGTTGTIAITTGGASFVGIAAWAVYGLLSTTPSDTVTDTGTTLSGLIDYPSNGIIIAAATNRDAAPNLTTSWTGATENFDADAGYYGFSGASETALSGGTGQTISAAFGATDADDTLVAVTWA